MAPDSGAFQVEVIEDGAVPALGDARRPRVTWSYAATLDGRSAAKDGSSQWISNPAALRDTHRMRAESDLVLVGTETAEIDNPALTARVGGALLPAQPSRAVMGLRELSPGLQLFDGSVPTFFLKTRDPELALAALAQRGIERILLEGGPTLAAAFLRAGLIDEVVVYIAPMLLGAGRVAVGDLGIETLAGALRGSVTDVTVLAGEAEGDPPNIRVTLRPEY